MTSAQAVPSAHRDFTSPPATPAPLPGASTDQTVISSDIGLGNVMRRDRALVTQIALLQLEPVQKAYLSERWLCELDYLGSRAREAQNRNERLRLLIVVGGVAITALAGLNVGGDQSKPFQAIGIGLDYTLDDLLRGSIFLLGLLVALAAALEGSFRWGERWRHFRQQSEMLRAEGWAFLQLAGPSYQTFNSHGEAFQTFVGRVEEAIQKEVGIFVAQVARVPELDDQTLRYAQSQLPTATIDPDGSASARGRDGSAPANR